MAHSAPSKAISTVSLQVARSLGITEFLRRKETPTCSSQETEGRLEKGCVRKRARELGKLVSGVDRLCACRLCACHLCGLRLCGCCLCGCRLCGCHLWVSSVCASSVCMTMCVCERSRVHSHDHVVVSQPMWVLRPKLWFSQSLLFCGFFSFLPSFSTLFPPLFHPVTLDERGKEKDREERRKIPE